MMQVLAMHGWAGQAGAWSHWRQRFEDEGARWSSADRGYGGGDAVAALAFGQSVTVRRDVDHDPMAEVAAGKIVRDGPPLLVHIVTGGGDIQVHAHENEGLGAFGYIRPGEVGTQVVRHRRMCFRIHPAEAVLGRNGLAIGETGACDLHDHWFPTVNRETRLACGRHDIQQSIHGAVLNGACTGQHSPH